MFGKNKPPVVIIRWNEKRQMFYAELSYKTLYSSNKTALQEDLKKYHNLTKTKLSRDAEKAHGSGKGNV